MGFALGTGTLALQGLTAALCLSFLLPLAPPPLSMGPVPAALAEGKTLVRFRSFDNSIFAEAKRDNKFVLLDLEAVWCHWCHVMDEKTYGNEAVADLLNSRFICVKVDQDAQPDLSVKYEDYGWPATIIFDGEGREIVKRSGYINPEKMKALLEAIIKDPSPEEAEPPSASLSSTSAAESNADAESKNRGDSDAKRDANDGLSETLRQDLLDKHLQGYDAKYGAWGTYQKFLDWDSVEYSMLIGLGKDQSDARSYQERARKTLDGELNLLDPAFGGVYQYSTDGDWKHAHFEKIMQTQAENLRIYALGSILYGDKRYLQAARAIAAYLQEFLCSPQGAFYTSQDADLVPGVHSGGYFQLSKEARLKKGSPRVDKHIYARENGWAICALAHLYGATGDGAYLDQALKALTWIEANRSLGDGGFSHDQKDASGPYLGDTLAMGRAYLALYGVTGRRNYLQAAERCADFMEAQFRLKNGPGYGSARDSGGPIKPVPLLDENVMLSRFCNLLYRYSGEPRYRSMSADALRYLAQPEAALKRKILVAGILLADAEFRNEPTHITVVGPRGDELSQMLFAAANKLPLVYKRIEWWDASEGPMPNKDTELPQLSQPAAFACSDGRCSRPAHSIVELTAILRN
ncbi:MAG: thioredoxin domain-containing protein [Candidatus Obscuribacter sp.]|nr:thioredoxin domain-containing protein [Candidatus Obscuribacter sp.]